MGQWHFAPDGTTEGLPVGEVASKGRRLLSVGGQGAVCRRWRCRKACAAGRLAQISIPIHSTGDINGQVYLILRSIDRIGLPHKL